MLKRVDASDGFNRVGTGNSTLYDMSLLYSSLSRV